MKKFLILFLLLFSFGFCQNLSFKDKLKEAHKGDFIVFEFNKFYSALCVFDIENENIILEEITIAKNKFDKNISFREWIENGAKKNNSWTIYKIDLQTNKIKDAFSICKNSWIKLTTNESLITGFLNINFKKLENSKRKKIGFPTQFDPVDKRPFWNPIKIVNSKKIIGAKFDVYRSYWPIDGSEFASKIFDIYLTDDFSFPYFIEINSGNTSYIIRAIDSGTNLKSTIKYFPRKKPEITQIKKEKNSLFLNLSNATDFKEFNLFAIDLSQKNKIVLSLEFQVKKEMDLIFLEINLDHLNKIFEKNHKYKLIAIPKVHKNLYIESKELFIWK
jgi:hypothetical protein